MAYDPAAVRRTLRRGWGLDRARLRLLRDMWNLVVDVRTADARYVLRLHSPSYHRRAGVESELRWLEALRASGHPVGTPIRARDGELTCVAEDGRVASLLAWVSGRKVGRRLGPRTLRTLGELTARLHAHAAGWGRPADFTRPTWDADALGRHLFEPRDERGWDRVDRKHHPAFRAALARAAEAEALLRASGPDAFGLVHADLHGGNLIHAAGGLAPIDFDDCGFAPLVYDLAVPLATVGEGARSAAADALLEGYRAVRPFPDAWIDPLDAWIGARAVTVALFVAAFAIDRESWRPAAERGAEATGRLLERLRGAG